MVTLPPIPTDVRWNLTTTTKGKTMTTFNMNTHLKSMRHEVKGIATVDTDAMSKNLKHYRNIGGSFGAILTHDRQTTEDLSPHACYAKHAKVLEPIMGKTIMVGQCYELSLVSEASLKPLLATYLKVGIGDKSKLKTGAVKRRMDFFAEAVKANGDKRWNRKTGEIKSASNRTSTLADKREVAAKQVETACESIWGEEVADNPAMFDFRYFTDEELKAVDTALKAELRRREAKGKVMS